MPEIHLIAAMDENRVIGHNNTMPWHLPADLKHFKKITTGFPIIMGRKTFESIGKPLPGRTSVIITGQHSYNCPGCVVVHSLDEALNAVSETEKAFIIGGASIYQQALPYADVLHLTLIHYKFEGDTHFPEVRKEKWLEASRESHQPDRKNPYLYTFIIYRRKNS